MQRRYHVYRYFFDKSKRFYVGISSNVKKRHRAHRPTVKKLSAVGEYWKETSEVPRYEVVTKQPLHPDAAVYYEAKYLEEFKAQGWVALNKAPAGSLGYTGPRPNPFEIKVIMLKCEDSLDFLNKHEASYRIYNKIISKDPNYIEWVRIYESLRLKTRENSDNFWTYSKAKATLSEVKTVKEAREKGLKGLMNWCRKQGHDDLLDILDIQYGVRKWTQELIEEKMIESDSWRNFKNKYQGALSWCYTNKRQDLIQKYFPDEYNNRSFNHSEESKIAIGMAAKITQKGERNSMYGKPSQFRKRVAQCKEGVLIRVYDCMKGRRKVWIQKNFGFASM